MTKLHHDINAVFILYHHDINAVFILYLSTNLSLAQLYSRNKIFIVWLESDLSYFSNQSILLCILASGKFLILYSIYPPPFMTNGNAQHVSASAHNYDSGANNQFPVRSGEGDRIRRRSSRYHIQKESLGSRDTSRHHDCSTRPFKCPLKVAVNG